MALKSHRCAPSLGVLLITVLFPSLAVAIDVPKWTVYEISLKATGSSPNWYTDPNAVVAAKFTGPGGVTQTVNGYWNGDNSFEIRFAPTAEGTWTYTTSSPNAGLNNQSGTINATNAEAANHGFLRIDPAYPKSFVWDDGAHDFMCGQTYYSLMYDAMVNDNWKAAVDNSRAYGMNKVRMFVYAQGGFVNLASVSHGYPDVTPYSGTWDNPNRDSLNFDYWQKLDEVVEYMQAKGMVADLLLTNFYRNGEMSGTDAQNDRFLRYVAARYAAYDNVIWCLANEWDLGNGGDYPQDQADFNRFGDIMHNSDPWMAAGAALRPLSIHRSGGKTDFGFNAASWPTHVILQYGGWNEKPGGGHFTNGDEWGNWGIVANLGRNMPVVNDEYGYVGQTTSPVPMDRTKLRGTIWGIATAGGYGAAGDIRIFGSDETRWTPCRTGEWADAPDEYSDIKRMVDFFTTKGVEYWTMTSHNELKTSGTRTYVLAEPGRQYVVYAAVGGTFTINLPDGDYYAYRYNPRTGETSPLPNVAGGSRTFALPDANDWVIHLSTFQEVPEPTSFGLLGFGLAALTFYCKQRQRLLT